MNELDTSKLLLRFPDIRLLIVFGSVAKGSATPASDIDIAIDLGTPMTADDKFQMISEIAVLTGRPVDLIDLKMVGQPLLGQILKYGKRLLGSDNDYAQLVMRNIFDHEDFVPLQNRLQRERREAWINKRSQTN